MTFGFGFGFSFKTADVGGLVIVPGQIATLTRTVPNGGSVDLGTSMFAAVPEGNLVTITIPEGLAIRLRYGADEEPDPGEINPFSESVPSGQSIALDPDIFAAVPVGNLVTVTVPDGVPLRLTYVSGE